MKPGAKQERIGVGSEGLLDIAVSAPPVQGKANAALVKVLSRRLRVPKSRIEILKGHTSRNKVVSIQGIDRTRAIEILQNS